MKFITAITLIALSVSAHAEVTDALFPAAVVMHVIDYGQTLSISNSCRSGGKFHEQNIILGECPTRLEVTQYFAATAAIGIAAHYMLPKRYQKYSDAVWLTVETGAVAHNAAIGIKIRF